jgi:hypothetical protein
MEYSSAHFRGLTLEHFVINISGLGIEIRGRVGAWAEREDLNGNPGN